MLRQHGTAVAGFAALVLVFAACEGSSLFAPEGSIASMSVEPAAVSIDALGAARKLSTVGRDSTGTAIGAVRVTWTSLNPNVASVDADGTVTAMNVGKALIIASAACCATVDTAEVEVRQVVATVRMTPGSATVKPDSTIVVDAIPRDGRGNPIPDRPITWTSSAPDVAVVDASGNVRALKAGSATITATVDDKTGSSAFVVADVGSVAPPPPPPSGVMFSDDFEAGFFAPATNGVSWRGTAGGRTPITTEKAFSGTHALKFHYAGNPDICSDDSAERRFDLPNMSEVWIEFMFFVPSNFTHRRPTNCSSNAADRKLIRIWGPTNAGYGGNNPKGGAAFNPTGNGDSWVFTQWGDYNNVMLTGQAQNPPNRWEPAFTDANRGKWIQLRWHFKLASADGARDGALQLWVDGALVVNQTGIPWHTQAGVGNWFSTGYLMGWANTSYADDTDFFVDDFRVFGSDPGW